MDYETMVKEAEKLRKQINQKRNEMKKEIMLEKKIPLHRELWELKRKWNCLGK